MTSFAWTKSKFLLKPRAVRTCHAVHRIENDLLLADLKVGLDSFKVEELLHQGKVLGSRVDDFDIERSAVHVERFRADLVQIHFESFIHRFELDDGLRDLVDFVRDGRRRRASIRAVELDAEVGVNSARVMRRSQ